MDILRGLTSQPGFNFYTLLEKRIAPHIILHLVNIFGSYALLGQIKLIKCWLCPAGLVRELVCDPGGAGNRKKTLPFQLNFNKTKSRILPRNAPDPQTDVPQVKKVKVRKESIVYHIV